MNTTKLFENWRVSPLTAVIVSQYSYDGVLLYDFDKKLSDLDILTQNKEVVHVLDEFRVRITTKEDFGDYIYKSEEFTGSLVISQTGMTVFIQSPELPKPDYWYLVLNYFPAHLGNLVLENTIDQEGVLEGSFSGAVNSGKERQKYVSFVSESMKYYDNCLNNSIRYMNVKTKPSTKKWKPGYRYDSTDETIYFLGKIEVKRFNSAEFAEDPKVEGWLYTNSIRDCKTIKEVIDSSCLGSAPENLKLFKESVPPGFVEVEKALENDLSEVNIEDNIPVYLGRQIESIRAKEESIVIRDITRALEYRNQELGNVYRILAFHISGKQYPEISELLEDLTRFLFRITLYKKYNVTEYFNVKPSLGTEKTPEENINSLIELTLGTPDIASGIYFGYPMIRSIYRFYNVDLVGLATEALENWDPLRYSRDFDTFIKHFQFHQIRNTKLMGREHLYGTVDLGNGELREIVKELIKHVRSWENPNKRSEMAFQVTLGDIVRYYKGVDSIPESLKSEIVRYRFCGVSFTMPKSEYTRYKK